MSEKLYIGVDLGGTMIKTGICSEDGELLQTCEGPTEADKGVDAVIHNIASYVRKLVAESPYEWEQIAGIGAGIAAFLDINEGWVTESPNLRWRNVPIKEKLEEALNKPVKIDNDANAAALGEALAGAGKGIGSLVCYTLGTGVGAGIMIDGKIVRGFSGMGGEVGHISVVPDLEAIQCGCGQMGCLETVSSAAGIVWMAYAAVERGERTTLSLLEDISAKDVFDAAKAGDEVALRIIQRAAYYLGKSMAIVAVIVNPQRFILAGGMAGAGEILLQPIREAFQKHTPSAAQNGVDIVLAKFGPHAGVVGAAGLFK
jgi:glucokinase